MERRVVDTRTSKDLNSGSALWETPPAVYEKLSEDFGPFDVDLTANKENALCEAWLGPGSHLAEDARFAGDWSAFGTCGYSNPPYGPFVPSILSAAHYEADRADAPSFVSVFLLPMRVTEAFKRTILYGATELYFCDKRICFYEGGSPRLNKRTLKPDPAMFDSIIVVFGRRPATGLTVDLWNVPTHV